MENDLPLLLDATPRPYGMGWRARSIAFRSFLLLFAAFRLGNLIALVNCAISNVNEPNHPTAEVASSAGEELRKRSTAPPDGVVVPPLPC